MASLTRLIHFIREVRTSVFVPTVHENERPAIAAGLLRALVSRDDWLPQEMAETHPTHHNQHLLYCDPDDRFSVLSVVWGPGQGTPIHDHLTWGAIGMLRGAEWSQQYCITGGVPRAAGMPERLGPGQVTTVSPRLGDVHRVWNAFHDRASVSIHLYGGDIGKIERHAFDAATGTATTFVSGYANRMELAP
jgi:predicted metal-dependent enzyme (double-stranded beta helix superfamily)